MQKGVAFTAIVFLHIMVFLQVNAQDFEINEITGNIIVVTDKDGGGNQLVVQSEKGLVVFNTFWSETTSRKFKDEIASALGRNDFLYTINNVE